MNAEYLHNLKWGNCSFILNEHFARRRDSTTSVDLRARTNGSGGGRVGFLFREVGPVLTPRELRTFAQHY